MNSVVDYLKQYLIKADRLNLMSGSTRSNELLIDGHFRPHLLVTMDPKDFINLTTTYKEQKQNIIQRESSIPMRKYNPTGYELPFLVIEAVTGRVRGHEGRHRAASVIASGGSIDKFPVAIYLCARQYRVKYWVKHHNARPYVKSEIFTKEKDALKFVEDVQKKPTFLKFDDSPLDYTDHSILGFNEVNDNIVEMRRLLEPFTDPKTGKVRPVSVNDMPRKLYNQFTGKLAVDNTDGTQIQVGIFKRQKPLGENQPQKKVFIGDSKTFFKKNGKVSSRSPFPSVDDFTSALKNAKNLPRLKFLSNTNTVSDDDISTLLNSNEPLEFLSLNDLYLIHNKNSGLYYFFK